MADAHLGVEHFTGRGRIRERDTVQLEVVLDLFRSHADRMHWNAIGRELSEPLFTERAAVLRAVGNQHDARERSRRARLHHRIERVADARLWAGRRDLVQLLQRLHRTGEAEQPHAERFAKRIERAVLKRGDGFLEARSFAFAVRHAGGAIHHYRDDVLAIADALNEKHRSPQHHEHRREQQRLQRSDDELLPPREMTLAKK